MEIVDTRQGDTQFIDEVFRLLCSRDTIRACQEMLLQHGKLALFTYHPEVISVQIMI